MFREMVDARPIVLYLQELAAIRTHSENGKSRKTDKEDYETESHMLFQKSSDIF